MLYKGLSVADREWVKGHFVKLVSLTNGVRQYNSYILPEYMPLNEAVWIIPGTECLCADMQLCDAEGNKVTLFQNDIIKCRDHTFVVSFGHCGKKGINYSGYRGFYLEGYDNETKKRMNEGLRNDIYYWVCLGDAKYIGNLYDNDWSGTKNETYFI